MKSVYDRLFETWGENEGEAWPHEIGETIDHLREESGIEDPSAFFEGVAVAFPICLLLWFLIYLGIRAIWF